MPSNLCAKVVNGVVVQYPYVSTQPKPDEGILPVVVKKPKRFRDEEEVWLDVELKVVDNTFVEAIYNKRAKTQQELDEHKEEKRKEKERNEKDCDFICVSLLNLIQLKKVPRERLLELKKEIDGSL